MGSIPLREKINFHKQVGEMLDSEMHKNALTIN